MSPVPPGTCPLLGSFHCKPGCRIYDLGFPVSEDITRRLRAGMTTLGPLEQSASSHSLPLRSLLATVPQFPLPYTEPPANLESQDFSVSHL